MTGIHGKHHSIGLPKTALMPTCHPATKWGWWSQAYIYICICKSSCASNSLFVYIVKSVSWFNSISNADAPAQRSIPRFSTCKLHQRSMLWLKPIIFTKLPYISRADLICIFLGRWSIIMHLMLQKEVLVLFDLASPKKLWRSRLGFWCKVEGKHR